MVDYQRRAGGFGPERVIEKKRAQCSETGERDILSQAYDHGSPAMAVESRHLDAERLIV